MGLCGNSKIAICDKLCQTIGKSKETKENSAFIGIQEEIGKDCIEQGLIGGEQKFGVLVVSYWAVSRRWQLLLRQAGKESSFLWLVM